LLGALIIRRIVKARTAQRLAVAFWEELSAVHFSPPTEAISFAGFSSQTFDTLFKDFAETLPETLGRDLMRYHWRMKWLEEIRSDLRGNAEFLREAQTQNADLRYRLAKYGRRSLFSVFLLFREIDLRRTLSNKSPGLTH
jgi:hypothetical protein